MAFAIGKQKNRPLRSAHKRSRAPVKGKKIHESLARETVSDFFNSIRPGTDIHPHRRSDIQALGSTRESAIRLHRFIGRCGQSAYS
jgi:hypothetical protein